MKSFKVIFVENHRLYIYLYSIDKLNINLKRKRLGREDFQLNCLGQLQSSN